MPTFLTLSRQPQFNLKKNNTRSAVQKAELFLFSNAAWRAPLQKTKTLLEDDLKRGSQMLEVCFHYKTTVAEDLFWTQVTLGIKKITLLLGERETGLLLKLIF